MSRPPADIVRLHRASDAVWSASAERSVLGWLFLRSQRGDDPFKGLEDLRPDDFYDLKHRTIFEGCRALHAIGKVLNPTTIEAQLKLSRRWDATGGFAIISDLLAATNHEDERALELGVVHLRDLSVRRRAAQAIGQCMDQVSSGADIPNAVRDAKRVLDAIAGDSLGADRSSYGSGIVELLGEDEPEDDGSDQLVAGLLPAEAPAVVAGPPKSNKTMAALDMAICIATGQPWLGRFDTREGRVLLLLHEDPLRETRRRLWRLCRGHGLDPRDLDGRLRVDVASTFRFDDLAHLDRMRRTLDEFKPSLVVLDSLSRMHTADENSKREMGVVTIAWSDLCRGYGTTVAVIHHYNKNGEGGPGHRMRGSGDLFALARGVVGVERTKDGARRVTTEGNLERQAEPFAFAIDDGVNDQGKKIIRLLYQGSAEDQEARELERRILEALAGGPLSTRDLRKAVGGRGAAVDDAARRLARRQQVDQLTNRRWRLWPTE